MREMRRICDVPKEQLEAEMRQFAQKKVGSVKAARSFFTECRNGNKKRWDRRGTYKTSLSDAW